jgi:hypothetical protein
LQTANLVASLKKCAPGDFSCISQNVANYQSVSTQQQQAAQDCNSLFSCQEVRNDAMSSTGVSESDINALCQGGTACAQFLEALGNQGVSAKSIANDNAQAYMNNGYMQGMATSLAASGLVSPSTAYILAMGLSPQDVAGATTSLIGSAATTSSTGPITTWDTSITGSGSRFLNIRTNLTASEFEKNLISNGYSIASQGTNTNGPFTVLTNGTSTYTTYVRSSTSESGAFFKGPNGVKAKFSFSGP